MCWPAAAWEQRHVMQRDNFEPTLVSAARWYAQSSHHTSLHSSLVCCKTPSVDAPNSWDRQDRSSQQGLLESGASARHRDPNRRKRGDRSHPPEYCTYILLQPPLILYSNHRTTPSPHLRHHSLAIGVARPRLSPRRYPAWRTKKSIGGWTIRWTCGVGVELGTWIWGLMRMKMCLTWTGWMRSQKVGTGTDAPVPIVFT